MSAARAMDVTSASVQSARGDARKLGAWAYAALALGLVLYIVAIWFEVYVDTRKEKGAQVQFSTDEAGSAQALPKSEPDLVFQASHRHWRLRTAFVFLLWSVLGGLTLPFGVGWFVLIPAYLWYVYRIVRGVAWFALGRPIGLTRDARARRRVTQGNRS